MNINIASLGSMAWEVWQHDQIGRVIGATSRGLFLAIEPRVLFVSFERWRGPLTITLGRSIDRLRALDVGAAAVFSNHRLIFPATGITLFAAPDSVWQTPSPSMPSCPITQQRHILKQIANIILTREPDRGYSPLLSPLLDLPISGPLPHDQVAVLSTLQTLRRAVFAHDVLAVQDGIDQLLGRGSGLTPSGDDCALGLLLMLNRWKVDLDWTMLNQAVIRAAYLKTTAISASLIESAACGEADERLITVIDGIVTGSASIDECVACVLGWGSSSGLDTLIGMAIAAS